MTKQTTKFKEPVWFKEMLYNSENICYKFLLVTLRRYCEDRDISFGSFLAQTLGNARASQGYMNFLRDNRVPAPEYFRKVGIYPSETCDWLEWCRVNDNSYHKGKVRNKASIEIIETWLGVEEPPRPEGLEEIDNLEFEDYDLIDPEPEEKKGKEYWLARAWELDALESIRNGVA